VPTWVANPKDAGSDPAPAATRKPGPEAVPPLGPRVSGHRVLDAGGPLTGHTCGRRGVRTQVTRVSRRLTWLVPQPRHRLASTPRFPWSERFDRIFRNEEVAGSNLSAHQNALVRAILASWKFVVFHDPAMRRATGVPQDRALEHLSVKEGSRVQIPSDPQVR
jgi:hypothetical protein